MQSEQFRKIERRNRRIKRETRKIKITASRPRMVIFRSSKHMLVQIVDSGKVLTAASTQDKAIRESVKTYSKEAAVRLGKLIAEKAKNCGVERVVFDRRGYKFGGKVKLVVESAREGGIII